MNTACQQRTYKHPHPSLGKRFWFNVGVEKFLHIVQLHNLTAKVISGMVANNIPREDR